ncbi:dihydrolipoamide acetyltransferase family protein [Arthrobacter crystallopoietes]|uniref:Dihydrolipoamide acetyltransferase component of pyruvate dehydrogenase complex n=1 Tax=Crystallibacter crystallopoietes TaxID=37928 RepID=A0A1H1DPV9_9MICC|nr:dihydrolipoamide acetyltransferase family protein [Arthrobacter crystallopoietes]AUI50218.1 dihydrolipoamide acetyltransferase [Arthrobacter crystallopoietes]SDQ78443.1 pyruvate dehydrogenase E2 component (dihydrolipoamide acetyltransferase) [Arthrobacter crystallopoietes]
MPEVFMPRLSDTMEEGVISRWLKKEGDTVHQGDVIGEIDTDKATMDLEVFEDGVLEKLLVPEGTTVAIGEAVAIIGGGSGTGGGEAPGTSTTQSTTAAEAPAAPRESAAPAPSAAPAAPKEPAKPTSGGRVLTSPLARRIAAEHGIDPATLTGTGPGGRIVRADVEAAAAAGEGRTEKTDQGAQAGQPAQPSPTEAPRPAAAPNQTDTGADSVDVPLTQMRKATARRLTESAGAPHFFLTNVVGVDRLFAFRQEVNQRYADSGIKVSVTDLLVRACAVTLHAHPQVNSSWAGDKILQHRRTHIGVAVAIENGLIVPVVRDADAKPLDELAAETRELAEKARAGKLKRDEFRGGTFTISNLGMFGIDNFTAVINPPEAAILAVGAATEEPFVQDGTLQSRRIMKLTMTADHRVLDGATAAAFLRDLKQTLEEPLRILL